MHDRDPDRNGRFDTPAVVTATIAPNYFEANLALRASHPTGK